MQATQGMGKESKECTHSKEALCSIRTIRVIASKSSLGTLSQMSNASMSLERISLPGLAEMYVYGSSRI